MITKHSWKIHFTVFCVRNKTMGWRDGLAGTMFTVLPKVASLVIPLTSGGI